MKKNIQLTILLAFVILIYVFFGIMINNYGGTLNLRWLFWNLLLAVIPVGFALFTQLVTFLFKRWELFSLLSAALWLVFMPNACYMITDLIHLESSGLIGYDGTYLMNLKEWVELIYLGGGIFLALVAGLFSTSVIHCLLPFKHHSIVNLSWMILISLLCGYGVYIGRFLRLNSWDILHPRSLIQILLQNINRFTVLFTLMIAGFYFISYLIFDRLMQSENQKSKQTR